MWAIYMTVNALLSAFLVFGGVMTLSQKDSDSADFVLTGVALAYLTATIYFINYPPGAH